MTLYYVNRSGTEAYVLAGVEQPPLDTIERAVLTTVLSAAKTFLARAESNPVQGWPTVGPVQAGDAPNPLGLPFGLYYVSTDGSATYVLSGPDTPDLRHPELSVASALVYHAASGLHKERVTRGEV